jgi:outer membrane autotransporter protein
MAAPADTDGLALWTQAYGAWGAYASDGNAGKLDTSTGGVVFGADAPVGEWRVGVLSGYGHSSFDDDARASSADVDSYALGIFAGTSIKHVGPGDVGLRFGASHTWSAIDTDRSIAFPGLATTAAASYQARTAQIFGEAGYALHAGQASLEPFAGLAYVNLHTDGYDESGAAGLHAGSDDTGVTYTTFGLHAATDIAVGAMTGNLHATLGWRHAFGDTTPLATHAFAGSTAFTVAGTPIAEDAALMVAGFDLNLTEAAALGLSYQGQFGGGATQNGFKANLTVTF